MTANDMFPGLIIQLNNPALRVTARAMTTLQTRDPRLATLPLEASPAPPATRP